MWEVCRDGVPVPVPVPVPDRGRESSRGTGTNPGEGEEGRLVGRDGRGRVETERVGVENLRTE